MKKPKPDIQALTITALKAQIDVLQAEIGGLKTELADERGLSEGFLLTCRTEARWREKADAALDKVEQQNSVLRQALSEIAAYDKDSPHGPGICPYGCDTPWIARNVLNILDAGLSTL